MKQLILLAALALSAFGQQVTRWSMTTGDVSLSGAGTSATIQQPASGAVNVNLEGALVYCSVACTVTQSANGTAASATAGTVTPLLPANLGLTAPFNFFTASNASGGTAQGAAIHLGAGGTTTICLSTACGNAGNVALVGAGTNVNYTVTVSSITGTANISFIANTRQ